MRTLPRRAGRLVGLALLLTLLASATAQAAGDRLIQAAAPYKGWRLSSLRLEGVPKGLERPLREGLALAGRPRLGGLLGHTRVTLAPALLRQDADRVLLYLARHGYPRARLEARIEPRARHRAALTLLIEAGAPVRVAELEMTGLGRLEPRAPELRALLPQPGAVFADADLENSARRVEEELRRGGRASAHCQVEVLPLDSARLRLVCRVQPGPVCRVDSVRVTGVAPDLERLAARSLRPLLDHPASPRLLSSGQDRLRLLGVFRQIRFVLESPPDLEVAVADVTLNAELAPRPPRLLEAGAGWWTAEGGRLSGRWSHANFFKGGRGLQVSASASRVKQTGRTETWWPALGLPTLRGELALELDRQREESYGLLSRELSLGLRHQPSLLLTLSGGLTVAEVKVDRLSEDSTAFLATPGRQTLFSASALRNSTDNPLDPTRGTQFSLQAEWTIPGFFSSADYLRIEAERSAYRGLGSCTGAARLRLGLAWPLGASRDLLPNRRFFAGGADHRGFGRHMLGPRDKDGAALGGAALALGSVELRVPLIWKLGAAVFLDAGQVWRTPGEFRFQDVELAAGPALLLRTPVGPLRADLGWRLGAAEDQLDRWAVHVSIGHPF